MNNNVLSRLAIGLGLVAGFLTACRSQPPVTNTVDATSTTLPTKANTVTVTPTPTLTFTPTPSITPTRRPSRTATPSRTRKPTSAPTNTQPAAHTLTPTSFPPLSAIGPHLVYVISTSDGHKAVALLDADGIGRKYLPLPDGAYISDVGRYLSPSGEWIAFHTGSAENEPYDLTLNLMHLPDGAITTVTRLFSEGYPANFDELAEGLLQAYPDLYPIEYYSVSTLGQELQLLFRAGIHSLDWSPDSRYLAFAGQMDGPSSDIYRLDMNLHTIIRLTDGPDQIISLSWSSDGRWILHEASNDPLGQGWTPNVYAVQWDGNHGKKILERDNVWGWLTPTTYAVYDSQNGPGDYNLRILDIDTDQTIYHWPESFAAFEFDPVDHIMILLYTYGFSEIEQEHGIYIIYPNIGEKIIPVPGILGKFYYLGGDKYLFLLSCYLDGMYGITKEGDIELISDYAEAVYMSPDRNWFLIANFWTYPPGIEQGVYLYQASGEYTGLIMDREPDQVTWSPDSQAVFFRIEENLYRLPIPDGKPALVDTHLAAASWSYSSDPSDFGWSK